MDPQPAGGPHRVVVANSAGAKLEITDVMFGEVWHCAGQSNMKLSVSMLLNASAEYGAAPNPDIRLFTVGSMASPTPTESLANVLHSWRAASAAAVECKPCDMRMMDCCFSAVCYLFGKRLHSMLQLPIGLVDSSIGGSPIEYISSPEAI